MSNKVNIPVVDLSGKESGSFSAPADLFGIEPNEAAVHFVCEGQRFRFYKKTATVKGRSMVSGGGKKSRKQKGTGGARQGGTRAPHWVGGGIAFGPTGVKRDFKVNKKMRRLALASILSDRQSSGQVKVLKENPAKPASKTIAGMLKKLSMNGARVGFVVKNGDESLSKSVRNIKNVDLLIENQWTTLDFIKTDALIFSQGAIEQFATRFEKGAV